MVLVTLVAAFLFGLSTVLEQRSTKEVPERGALSPRLLADLSRRPLWLVDFGVTAFLLKRVPDTLPQGFGDPSAQWPLYLLVIVGPLGFLLNQSALQAATLIAPVLAVITAVDPLASIGIAHVWLHENIAATPLDLAALSLALSVMTAGIIALAYRAPQAAERAGLNARPQERCQLRD